MEQTLRPRRALMQAMRRLFALVLLAVLALPALAQAPARIYNQAELDALLAPVALYPDPLLSNILVAATYPEDLREAAHWSRANPQLGGEQAVHAAEPLPWHPSVKALLATPELLARMDESPQWTADLAAAFVNQEPHVMDTVQGLRRRAQATGHLDSTPEYQVQQHGHAIAVYSARPHVIYVPYYDPYVVYGPWWWHSYRPVYWRPWYPRPAIHVSSSFFHSSVDWHRRHVHRGHNHVQHRQFAPRAIDVARHAAVPHRVHPPQHARQFGPRAADIARQATGHNPVYQAPPTQTHGPAAQHRHEVRRSAPRPEYQRQQIRSHESQGQHLRRGGGQQQQRQEARNHHRRG